MSSIYMQSKALDDSYLAERLNKKVCKRYVYAMRYVDNSNRIKRLYGTLKCTYSAIFQ